METTNDKDQYVWNFIYPLIFVGIILAVANLIFRKFGGLPTTIEPFDFIPVALATYRSGDQVVFNYKDFTYLRVAVLNYIEKLSSIEEDASGVGDDRFSEVQDDVQYLGRLRDLIDREIADLQSQPKKQVTRLSIVPTKDQPE